VARSVVPQQHLMPSPPPHPFARHIQSRLKVFGRDSLALVALPTEWVRCNAKGKKRNSRPFEAHSSRFTVRLSVFGDTFIY
jgi:hypothetical protein